jgi:hypothetical protein
MARFHLSADGLFNGLFDGCLDMISIEATP